MFQTPVSLFFGVIIPGFTPFLTVKRCLRGGSIGTIWKHVIPCSTLQPGKIFAVKWTKRYDINIICVFLCSTILTDSRQWTVFFNWEKVNIWTSSHNIQLNPLVWSYRGHSHLLPGPLDSLHQRQFHRAEAHGFRLKNNWPWADRIAELPPITGNRPWCIKITYVLQMLTHKPWSIEKSMSKTIQSTFSYTTYNRQGNWSMRWKG